MRPRTFVFCVLCALTFLVKAADRSEYLGVAVRDIGDEVTGIPRAKTDSAGQWTERDFRDDLGLAGLSKRLAARAEEVTPSFRGVREAQIYASVSPSVVLVVTKDSLGSGSVITQDGKIITNWHVVGANSEVMVIFKPAIEGTKISEKNAFVAKVIRIDQIADLALLQVVAPPAGLKPIALDTMRSVSVGSDVHAIGHPTGETWTYTKGFVSQMRKDYEWRSSDTIRHKASVIQTQTPINPGNSGGPLLNETGRLVGVNTFKAEGESINFAVDADQVSNFLSATQSRVAGRKPNQSSKDQTSNCEPRELKRGRNKANDADIVVFDITCSGVAGASKTIPDDPSKPILLSVDSKGTGKVDVVYVDEDRDGKWDISLYDTDGDGKADLVGYHRDGNVRPYRVAPYVASR